MTTDIQPTPRDTERQAETAIARRSFDSLQKIRRDRRVGGNVASWFSSSFTCAMSPSFFDSRIHCVSVSGQTMLVSSSNALPSFARNLAGGCGEVFDATADWSSRT